MPIRTNPPEIEDDLFGDTDCEEAEARTLLPDSIPMPPDLARVETEIEVADIPVHGGYTDLPTLTDQLGGTLGTGFPGAPGGTSTAGTKGGAAWRPPTDLLAFYLPWHEFPLLTAAARSHRLSHAPTDSLMLAHSFMIDLAAP